MIKRKVAHKQSKYFTIMLIPDSAIKVKSIKIPHWVFYALGGIVTTVACITILSRTQVSRIQEELDSSHEKLVETIKETEVEKTELRAAFEVEKSVLLDQKETVEEKIEGFETKIDLLQEKINTIDTMKEEIYTLISDFEDMGAITLSTPLVEGDDGTDPKGGPYVPASPEGSFDQKLDLLDVRLSRDIEEIELLKDTVNDAQPFFMAYPSGWPVFGRVTSEFGNRGNPFGGSGTEGHSGIDIKANTGTSIACTGKGKVSFAGVQNGYGNLVIIDHGFGYSTYYAHNSRLLVNVGDEVTRGDIIALAGSTGRSTGSHCHYEVRINQTPQNPRNYLD